MKQILIIGSVGLLAYVAFQEYKKRKPGCPCGCNSCQDTKEPTLLQKAEMVPDQVRQVFDANVASHFRTYFNKDSKLDAPAFGAGSTDNIDPNSATALVQY